MKKIYAVKNPHSLSDIFIFSTRVICKKSITVYVKINYCGKIEEIGTDIEERMNDWTLKNIIESNLCSNATKTQKRLLNSIGNEFFARIVNMKEPQSM
jgi:hypothetical protein